MEKLLNSLKKNILLAMKRVFNGKREFAWFFAVLFILECALCAVAFTYDSAFKLTSGYTESEYDWHMAYLHLNGEQTDYLSSFSPAYPGRDVFKVVRITEREGLFDVYIFFKLENAERAHEIMKEDAEQVLFALQSEASISVDYSPLYDYGSGLAAHRAGFIPIALLALVVFTILLGVLYSIRANHEKFSYGVYMTCGADMKKLTETSVWELAVIAVAVFLPACFCGAVLSAFSFDSGSAAFFFTVSSVLWVLPVSVLASLAAVLSAVRVISLRQPASLLAAEDNSNLAASPRRSVVIADRSFPRRYEVVSFWRFRRYFLRLALSASVFCVLFICCLYASRLLSAEYENRKLNAVSYSVSFESEDDLLLQEDEIAAIAGVRSVTRAPVNADARYYTQLLSVKNRNVLPFSGLYANPEGNGEVMLETFTLSVLDANIARELERVCETEGEPAGVTGEFAVVIGETCENRTLFSFSPGDTVTLYEFLGIVRLVDDGISGKDLLYQKMRYFSFEKLTLTVGAVVKNTVSTDTGLMLYVSPELYTRLTGEAPEFKRLLVTLSNGADAAYVGNEINRLLSRWDSGTCEYLRGEKEAALLSERGSDRLFFILAFLSLMLTPVLWFYSQLLYYRKRRGEFTVLRALFAVPSEIRRIHLIGGLLASLLSVIAALPISLLGAALFRYAYNYAVPKWLGVRITVLALPSLPVWWFAVAFGAALLCGFLSALLPYLNYIKHADGKNDTDALSSEV